MRRRRSPIIVLLAAAAIILGLYAASAAAKPPPPPNTCSNSPTSCTWNGSMGLPLQQECDAKSDPNGLNGAYLLWIFTTGGNSISGGATLTLGGTGSGSYAGTAMGKEFHFVTPYFTPGPSLTAVVSYGGSLGNAHVTISHGCAGSPPDTTPPSCELTSYTTYPSSTEKSSITVTLQDSGSGIKTVVATTTNANATTSPFTPPTISPITVTATKIIKGQGATLEIVVTDAAGNQTTCDPRLHAGRHVRAHPSVSQRGATVATGRLSMRMNRLRLTYGASSPVRLSGRLRSAPAGVPVTILGQAVGYIGLAPIATVKTSAGGAFNYLFHPAAGGFFAISVDGAVSPSLRVHVRPLVRLARTASGHYRVDVTTTNLLFLTGTKVLLQAHRGSHWATIAKTRLAESSTDTEPAVVSSGGFATSKGVGQRLRAVVVRTSSYVRGVSTPISG